VTYAGNKVIIDSATSHTVLTGFERYVFADGTVDNNDGNPLVDDLFYYSQNHDVWNAGADADRHYHEFGWHEGRDPSAFFSTATYLSLYPDVKAAGADPLEHFHQAGWKEGRAPSFAFDDAAYLAANPDVAADMSIRSRISWSGARRRTGSRLRSIISSRRTDSIMSTISSTIPMSRRLTPIRCSISRPSAGAKGATRMPGSTPTAIWRTTPTWPRRT